MNVLKKGLYGIIWLCAAFSNITQCNAQTEESVEFIVLITSYNNARWYKQNLDSVFCQTYSRWKIHYVDDCSTDGTGLFVEKYVQERGFSNKCTIVHNPVNQDALANYYKAISSFDPHIVVVNLDGDDRLAHPKVLEKLASLYRDPHVWMTYGSFVLDQGGWRGCAEAFPSEVLRTRSFRKYKWVLSHLRTYYAGLFQRIKKEDLLIDGKFFKHATDLSYMFPLVEMASEGHFVYVNEILYLYNNTNPLSVERTRRPQQLAEEAYIRALPSYRPLDKLF